MAQPYDDEPATSRGTPQFGYPRMTRVVRRLLIANAIVAVLVFVMFLVDEASLAEAIRYLGLDPRLWARWSPFVPAWQLITYGFLHSVTDIGHLLMNMLGLYFFGTMLEERLGGRRFLLTYMAAQVVGGLAFLVPVLFGHSTSTAVGASGGVLGILVAVAVLYPHQRVIFIVFPIQLMWLAIIVVGIDAYSYVMTLKGGSDGVAHLVHLGGAAYGYFAVRFGLIEKDPIQILERKRAVMQVAREADDEVRMDRLLEKIHQEGMASLSRSEKEFLKRMSSRR